MVRQIWNVEMSSVYGKLYAALGDNLVLAMAEYHALTQWMMAREASLIAMYPDNPELVALTAKVLPVFTAGMWIFGIQTGCQNTFIGLGQAKISLCFALLRKVVLLIPLALILPRVGGLGVWGVYLSEPIADVLSATCIGITFLHTYPRILSKEALNRV